MKLVVLRVIAIVVAGGLLGLAWNAWSGLGFALDSNVYVKPGDEVIEAPEAKARIDKGALALDARPVPFYEMEHVPGAVPLPAEPDEEFEKHFALLEPRLRSSFDIVVYCSGFGCEASHIAARKLKARGIQAAILQEGWPAWQAAGYPTRKGATP
jgi:rhodanese-related sulfurtransferase